MKFSERSSNPSLFQSFWSDTMVRRSVIGALVLNLASWGVLLFPTRDFVSLRALHYNIYTGIDWLGPWYQVFLLPLIGFTSFIFNINLARFFYETYRLLCNLLVVAAVFLQFILLIASIFIVWVNLG